MASVRAHARINSSADDVWKVVSEPTGLPDWFPGVATTTVAGNMRSVSTSNGIDVEEEIVTNDGRLRRFQYRLLPGVVPVEYHLATVDVIEDGDGAIVVYGCDVLPDALGPMMQQSADGAVAGLKEHVERA